MKKSLFCLVLTFVMAGFCSLSAQIQTFPWQGVDRQYMICYPAHHDGTPPAVFFLHGLGNNITNSNSDFHFQDIADEYGWALIVPQARNLGIGNMWNAGLMSSDVDDSGFLIALLDTLTARYQLDPDSVFFTGFSMGGFMTHRMAIEHGDRITACAPVSGLITNALSAQTPVTPVRLLHIHGTTDNVVGYDSYSSVFGSDLGLSVEEILQYWQTANGCTGEPTIDTLPDLKNDGLRFVRHTYNCGTDLQHLEVIGGTHVWYHNANQTDIAYLPIIHDFFVGANGTGVEEHETTSLQVWPNPNDGIVNVEVPATMTVEVVDMQGRVVIARQLEPGTNTLNLQHLPKGLYLLTSEGKEVGKVVLQ
ncbi:MAG: alpha/beta fold hydrolase [Bacteroidales bacterium]|nr:alpha/beta fold hydrolase [Bacteroidales bacterium]